MNGLFVYDLMMISATAQKSMGAMMDNLAFTILLCTNGIEVTIQVVPKKVSGLASIPSETESRLNDLFPMF